MNSPCITTFDGRHAARTCRAVALAKADPVRVRDVLGRVMSGRDHSVLAAARALPPSPASIATELDEKISALNYELSSNSR